MLHQILKRSLVKVEKERLHYLADRYYRDELSSLEAKEVELLLQLNHQDGKDFLNYIYETNQVVLVTKQVQASLKENPRKKTNIKVLIAIAALLLFGFFSFFLLPTPSQVEVVKRKPLLAKLIHLNSQKGQELSSDRWIQAGQYQLEPGKYQLAFTNGTKVNLQKEANFELIHETKMKLHKGSIIAHVTKEAQTFTVITPSAEIVDLGTVFMVKVNRIDHSNVLVREGSVKVTSLPLKESRVLGLHESIKVLENGQFERLENLERVFNLKEPLPEKIKNRHELTWHHWNFEQDFNALNHKQKHNAKTNLVPNHLHNNSLPKVCESPFGKGIRFDGVDDGLRTKYRGIGGNNPRTISLWARLPFKQPNQRGTCFIYWGNNHIDGRKWQITTNQRSGEGAKGALRLELRQGHVTGSTDLYDGRWHHIAVVFIGGYTSDVATHVMMYVDGVLEPITSYRHKVVDTDIDSSQSDPMSLGMYHGESTSAHHGDIDELWIFQQALMNEEIIRLRDFNSPFDQHLN